MPAKTTTETAYYLLSTPLTPERFGAVSRSHWGVLRHMAINLMQKDTAKGSLRGKIKRAGLDNAYLSKLLILF